MRVPVGEERGAVAIVVAALSVVFIGLAAFTVDFGQTFVVKRQLAGASDAGSLAAARDLGGRLGGCIDSVTTVGDTARATAQDYVDDNTTEIDGQVANLQLGVDGFAIDCTEPYGRVAVGVEQRVPSAFGALFGIGSVTTGSRATALFGVAQSAAQVRPFAMCSGSPEFATLIATGAVSAPEARGTVFLHPKTAPRRCSAGDRYTWTTVDLRSGPDANDNADGDCATVDVWVQAGSPCEIEKGTYTNADFVDPATLVAQMRAITGAVIAVPTYSSAGDDGLAVDGFVAFRVCSWRLGPGAGDASAPTSCSDQLQRDAEEAEGNLYIEARYEGTVLPGQVDLLCALGSPCDQGVHVTMLVGDCLATEARLC